jgi:hypothetical protein
MFEKYIRKLYLTFVVEINEVSVPEVKTKRIQHTKKGIHHTKKEG